MQVNIIDKLGKYPIYLSSSHAARVEQILKQHNITAVINLAQDLNDPWWGGLLSIKIGLTDGSSNSSSTYHLAVSTVLQLLLDGHTVLLHCHEGRSRTAAIATMIISRLEGISLEEAFKYVTKYRPLCAHMNEGHWEHINSSPP